MSPGTEPPPAASGSAPAPAGLRRIRESGRSRFLPPALLVAAVFLAGWFSEQRGDFFRPTEADRFTYNGLALASNLSAEHGYLGFYRRFVDGEGEVRYEPHNRFPPGGLFLLRAVIAPFPDDPSAQIYAARVLMWAFFAGIALMAYLALRRLTGSWGIAFAATLLSLSSYYWNYIDMVGTELAPDLFCFLLVFHGMALFVQEGRFAQLLLKTGAALLVGWHVYALLAPFLAFGWALVWIREGRRLPEEGGSRGNPVARVFAVLGSRCSLLAGTALVVGFGVLGWNFGIEYSALDGRVAFRDLPSVQSAAYRTGQDESFHEFHANMVAWGPFLEGQAHRVGRMAVPFALPGYVTSLRNYDGVVVEREGLLLAVLVLGVSFFGRRLLRHRTLFAALALSGFVWAIPLRHNTAFHDFEALYYLGAPLVFWTVALTALSRSLGAGFLRRAAALALAVFLFSHYRIAAYGYDAETAAYWRRVEADFAVIRPLTAEAAVFYPGWLVRDRPLGTKNILPYFLSGRVLVDRADRRADGDFALSTERRPGPALLTPDNREVFLYGPEALDGDLYRDLFLPGAGTGR